MLDTTLSPSSFLCILFSIWNYAFLEIVRDFAEKIINDENILGNVLWIIAVHQSRNGKSTVESCKINYVKYINLIKSF